MSETQRKIQHRVAYNLHNGDRKVLNLSTLGFVYDITMKYDPKFSLFIYRSPRDRVFCHNISLCVYVYAREWGPYMRSRLRPQ